MSKLKFIQKFFLNRKEIGAIIPSSRFLANKVVKQKDIEKAKIIIEMGAGTGSFTKKIFEYSKNDLKNKKIFIIEKDIDLYNSLLKKFPKYKKYIFNEDILRIEKILKDNNVENIDLIISGLPFKSLPLEIFYFVTKEFLPKYFNQNSIFIQFSYFKNFGLILKDHFFLVERKKCFFNLPSAHIFRCTNFGKKC